MISIIINIIILRSSISFKVYIFKIITIMIKILNADWQN